MEHHVAHTSLLHAGYRYPLFREWQRVAGGSLTQSHLMYPLFLTDHPDDLQPIEAMPGQMRVGLNRLSDFIRPLVELGLRSVMLFGVPTRVQKVGSNQFIILDLLMTIPSLF